MRVKFGLISASDNPSPSGATEGDFCDPEDRRSTSASYTSNAGRLRRYLGPMQSTGCASVAIRFPFTRHLDGTMKPLLCVSPPDVCHNTAIWVVFPVSGPGAYALYPPGFGVRGRLSTWPIH